MTAVTMPATEAAPSSPAARWQVVPFEPAHLSRIAPRSFDWAEMDMFDDAAARGRAYAAAGPAFTALVGEEVAFCAGAVQLWPGVAEAWSVTSALVERHPVTFHRLVWRMLAHEQRRHGCRRLQAAVHKDHRASIRWLHRLGFVYEGRMEAYGPDGTAYLRFARLLQAGEAPSRIPDAGSYPAAA